MKKLFGDFKGSFWEVPWAKGGFAEVSLDKQIQAIQIPLHTEWHNFEFEFPAKIDGREFFFFYRQSLFGMGN